MNEEILMKDIVTDLRKRVVRESDCDDIDVALFHVFMLYKTGTAVPLQDIQWDSALKIVNIIYNDGSEHPFTVNADDTAAKIVYETAGRIYGDMKYGRYSK